MSLIAPIGSLTLILRAETLDRLLLPMVAFAAGSLIGGAFFHMVPASLEAGLDALSIGIGIVAGFVVFFTLEQVLHWHHCHRAQTDCKQPLTYLVLLGDGLHNFIGGLAIAGTFLVDVRLGIASLRSVFTDRHLLVDSLRGWKLPIQSSVGPSPRSQQTRKSQRQSNPSRRLSSWFRASPRCENTGVGSTLSQYWRICADDQTLNHLQFGRGLGAANGSTFGRDSRHCPLCVPVLQDQLNRHRKDHPRDQRSHRTLRVEAVICCLEQTSSWCRVSAALLSS